MAQFKWQGEVGTVMTAEPPGLTKQPRLEAVKVSLGKGGADYVDEVSSLTKTIAEAPPDFRIKVEKIVATDLGLVSAFDRLLLKARGMLEREDFAEALEVLEGAVEADREHDEVRFLRGCCHDGLDEPEEALLALRGLKDSLFSRQVGKLRQKIRSRMLGDLMAENLELAKQGNLSDAVERLERAVEIDPEVGMYHYMLAGTLLMADRLDEAQRAAEHGLEYTKGEDRRRLTDLKGDLEQRILQERLAPARAHFRKGNYPRARSAVDHLAPAYRETPLCRTFRGYLEELGGGLWGLRRGKSLLAVRPRGRAKEVDALHFFLVGEEISQAKLLLRWGGFGPAAALLDDALRYAPHFPYAYFLKGNCHYNMVLAAFAVGQPPPLKQAEGLLNEALECAKRGAKDKEIGGAAPLIEAIEGALRLLAEARRQLEAEVAEMATVTRLTEALLAVRESAGEGIRSAAHYRETVDRLNELDGEIHAAERELSRKRPGAALAHLDQVVKANLKALAAIEGQVEESETFQELAEEFESTMKSAEGGISTEAQRREAHRAMTDIGERVQAFRRKAKDRAAAKAADDLVAAVERNCEQLEAIGKEFEAADQVRELMDEFHSVMERAKGGISSDGHAANVQRDLEGIRDRAQRLARQLESGAAKEQLTQLTQALEKNIEQLEGIRRGSAEAEPVRKVVERFNGLMKSVEGGIRSRYQMDEFREEIEKLLNEVPELFNRMRSPSAKENLGQLMLALLKVKEQLKESR